MATALNAQQQVALAHARAGGGLRYVRGGYWVEATVEPQAFLACRMLDRPWYTGTHTVKALVRRGLVRWTEGSNHERVELL